jgi:hypothetical protein
MDGYLIQGSRNKARKFTTTSQDNNKKHVLARGMIYENFKNVGSQHAREKRRRREVKLYDKLAKKYQLLLE